MTKSIRFSAIPAKKPKQVERGLADGLICDEFVAIATDEEQSESDACPEPTRLSFLAGIAVRFYYYLLI